MLLCSKNIIAPEGITIYDVCGIVLPAAPNYESLGLLGFAALTSSLQTALPVALMFGQVLAFTPTSSRICWRVGAECHFSVLYLCTLCESVVLCLSYLSPSMCYYLVMRFTLGLFTECTEYIACSSDFP